MRRVERPGPPRAFVRSPPATTWWSLGLSGRLAFQDLVPAGLVTVAWRRGALRIGLDAGGTVRGNALGHVLAGLLLVDASVLPLRHRTPDWSLAAELFVEGGALIGVGLPASSSIASGQSLDPVLAAGAGARLQIGPDAPVGLELAARVGYDVLGGDLRAGDTSLVTVHGGLASLDAALTFPVR